MNKLIQLAYNYVGAKPAVAIMKRFNEGGQRAGELGGRSSYYFHETYTFEFYRKDNDVIHLLCNFVRNDLDLFKMALANSEYREKLQFLFPQESNIILELEKFLNAGATYDYFFQ